MSLSGKGRRIKGLRGEREVAKLFQLAGLEVRNLEATGDHLIIRGLDDSPDLHLEVKRQETLKIHAWTRQAEDEAPPGTIPVVVYRRSNEPWRVVLKLDDLIGLLD